MNIKVQYATIMLRSIGLDVIETSEENAFDIIESNGEYYRKHIYINDMFELVEMIEDIIKRYNQSK